MKLKPCPFCGGQALFAKVETMYARAFAVVCEGAETDDYDQCYASRSDSWHETKKEAADQWNRRAHP